VTTGEFNLLSTPKLSVAGLYKVFGAKTRRPLEMAKAGHSRSDIQKETSCLVALQDVNFSVMPGEIFVVMGLSGSGKSTLIRCINRLIEPTCGMVTLDGDDISIASSSRLREMRRHQISVSLKRSAKIE
jgi:glycine betaine/proline transport system ATP-binding protein